MKDKKSLFFTLCGALALFVPKITFAQGNFYLTVNGGATLGFVKNYGVNFTYQNRKSETQIGIGSQTDVGIGYTSRKYPFAAELSLGTYEMSNPTDPSLIGLKLNIKDFTFQHRFYKASLRIGYNMPIASRNKKFKLQLIGGTSFLLNQPTSYYTGTWQYPDFSLWNQSDDLISARYNINEALNRQWLFLFNGGFRMSYAITPRLSGNAHLYYEGSFTTMRSILYSSERRYGHNPDEDYQVLSVYSGSAIGLNIGVHYLLR